LRVSGVGNRRDERDDHAVGEGTGMPRHALTYPRGDKVVDATLHVPAGDGPWPAIVMVTDIRGPRDVFYTRADRLAAEGYAVLLPNIFYRAGPAPVPDLSAPFEIAALKPLMALIDPLTSDDLRADGAAAVAALADRPEVRAGGIGVVGYCIGGKFAILYADGAGGAITAVAAYHGSALITDAPDSPHRVAAGVAARYYFGHADDDMFLPSSRLPELDATLAGAGRVFVSEVYEGAQHGFTVPDGPSYARDADDRHWRTMTALFAQTLR